MNGIDSHEARRATAEGTLAVNASLDSCPYGHDKQHLREAWCKARADAQYAAKPLWERMLFGRSVFATILSWVIFIAGLIVAYKLYELVFGCVDDFGRNYC